jgi:hypothetical protein
MENEIIIKYSHNIGDIVYFMYKNEVRKGIIARIDINIEAGSIKPYLTKKIVNKIIKIFKKDYPFEINVKYNLDLVSQKGDFAGAIGDWYYECGLFKDKNDLLKNITKVF